MRPNERIKRADAFSQPRAENIVHEFSSAASRIGSGLCNGSSKSGSFVSHKCGGTWDVLVVGAGNIFSLDVTIDVSDGGAVLNLEGLRPFSLPAEGLYLYRY